MQIEGVFGRGQWPFIYFPLPMALFLKVMGESWVYPANCMACGSA